jgi:hypothetical protein
MPNYFCIECGRPTEHLNVMNAARRCEVTRATIYNWIKRCLVHAIIHPSGRKFVCTESLLVPGFTRLHPTWPAASDWLERPVTLARQ